MALPLERLEIQQMASGNVSLLLTESIDWDGFPEYADELMQLLRGSIESRADGPDQRVWVVRLEGGQFWLSYDDYPLGVSLDSKDSEASALIPSIREKLLEYRAGDRR